MAGTLVGGVTGKPVGHGATRFEWSTLLDTETPDIAILRQGGDVGIQLKVNSGSATITFEGTLFVDGDDAPANFQNLEDIDGTVISTTSSGFFQLKVVPRFMRPVQSTTSSIDVVMIQRGV